LSLRGGKFGAFVACSNYPDCRYTQKFGQGGAEGQASEGPQDLGNGIELKSGRFGPYLEREGKRASIPKDVPVADVDAEMAERLLSLPREIGPHPETGKTIKASIGRYGPYLEHDGKYARLASTAEVFETGMNAAVAKLADAASGAGRREGASREPIAVLGAHPSSGKEIKVMAGRYGPYVSDGETHATLPKSADPKSVTLEQAVEWIDAKAAKGPSTKGKRKPARKKKA
jgi:DNA topoisomerase-1